MESWFFPRVHPQQELTTSTTPGLIKQASTYKVSGWWPMYLKSLGQTFGPTIKYLAYLLLFTPTWKKCWDSPFSKPWFEASQKSLAGDSPSNGSGNAREAGLLHVVGDFEDPVSGGSSNGGTPKWMVHNGTSENFPWMMTGGTPMTSETSISCPNACRLYPLRLLDYLLSSILI